MTRLPNGLFFDLLALVSLLVLSAVLQQTCGPWLWGLAKPPFLLAIASYYALLRPLRYAFPVAFIAGAWADGLGSVPVPATLFTALVLVGFCALHGRAVLNRTPIACTLLGTVGTLTTFLLQAIALRCAGRLADAPSVFLLRLVCQTALAIPVVFATSWFAVLFERATGNTPKEGKGAPVHART